MEPKKFLRWIGHLLIIATMVFPIYFQYSDTRPFGPRYLDNLISTLVVILIYGVNVFWLIPKFINTRKYKGYILSILVSMGLVMGVIAITHQPREPFNSEDRPEPPNQEFPQPRDRGRVPHVFFQFFPVLVRFSMVLGLGTTLELILLFDAERRRNDAMEKQKAISDLNFLKSQLNPHFLLNSLNNIYSLARKKSEDTTQAILILSNLLRHILYESGKNKISLGDEISFIKNYINLEKLKFSEENSPNINLTIAVQNMDYPIVPLLMMTLVENAFKHGVSYVTPSFILISVEENEKEIKLSVVNSLHRKENPNSTDTQKGLGIRNLEKQLELSYPGSHKFSQKIENRLFKSFLSIKK